MAFVGTALADVIVPAVFLPYVNHRIAATNAYWTSGVVAPDANLDALASEGGTKHNIPSWIEPDSADAVLTEAEINVDKILSAKEICITNNRHKAFGTTDIAKILAGSDPMGGLAVMVGDYWSRRYRDTLASITDGLMGNAEFAATNVLDVTGVVAPGDVYNGDNHIKAKQKLGDTSDRLTAIAMSSITEAGLRKLDQIDFVPESETKEYVRVYQGLRVIVDDALDVDATTTEVVLFGAGAIGYGNSDAIAANDATPNDVYLGDGSLALEWYRQPLLGQTSLIMRRRYILHPRGFSFTGTPVAVSPTNAEFATGTNWDVVWPPKDIPIVITKCHKPTL
jgi:hypothetical protein